jgi:hypothetical protein
VADRRRSGDPAPRRRRDHPHRRPGPPLTPPQGTAAAVLPAATAGLATGRTARHIGLHVDAAALLTTATAVRATAARVGSALSARAVNTWAEKAIAAGGILRLHDKVTTTKAEDSSQVRRWYTLNGAETKTGGFLKKESDGWCLFSFNNDAK